MEYGLQNMNKVRFEKLRNGIKGDYDFAIQINGWWLFSILIDHKGFKSLILLNRIIRENF